MQSWSNDQFKIQHEKYALCVNRQYFVIFFLRNNKKMYKQSKKEKREKADGFKNKRQIAF